jgi:hypothetical protein
MKKTTKTTNQSLDELKSESLTTVNNKRTSLSSGQRLSYRTDSAGADYYIYFWPKGALNLGLGGGFTGEFDSILFVGKQYQLSTVTESASQEEEKNVVSERTEQRKNAAKTEKKDQQIKRIYDPKLIVLAIIFLSIVIFLGKKLLF